MSASGSHLRVTVWNENLHEKRDEDVKARYPLGIHGTIAQSLERELPIGANVQTATLDQPRAGLGQAVLEATDVLVWWGHLAHEAVPDEIVEAVCNRVYRGMGLVVLHSGHLSRVFRRLMGTTCNLRWRNAGEREVIWTVGAGHPIAEGLPAAFVLDQHEMYGEVFDIPQPDHLVFISNFAGGEVFRSGCCFQRGLGRIFYFSPGDQHYPVYHDRNVQRILANSVLWAWGRVVVSTASYSLEQKALGWFVREAEITNRSQEA